MTAAKLRDELLVAKKSLDHIEVEAKKLRKLTKSDEARAIAEDIIEAADCASQAALATLQDFDGGVESQPAAPTKSALDPSDLDMAFGTSDDLNLALAQIRSVMAVINANGQSGFRKIDHFALLGAAEKLIEYRRDTMCDLEEDLTQAMRAGVGHE